MQPITRGDVKIICGSYKNKLIKNLLNNNKSLEFDLNF